MTEERKPLLNLSTLVDREFITIDNVAYYMNRPEDLGLEASAAMQAHAIKVNEFRAKPTLDADSAAIVALILREATQAIITAPPEILERLTDLQRLDIIESFLVVNGLASRNSEGVITVHLPTGAKSSPGSNASTAAKRKAG